MKIWAAVLLVVGLAQMVGDVLEIPAVKGIAAATMISPAPKVFSAVRGFETYSTAFYLELPTDAGLRKVRITPELYSRVRGPYNRRNVYGAALSYGPVLPESLRSPVMRYALCGEAPLLSELGEAQHRLIGNPRVRFEPREGTQVSDLPMLIEAPCK